MLVEKGARLNDTDTQGNTALIQAAKKGHFDTLQYLLLQGAKAGEGNENPEGRKIRPAACA